jgi:hypothetical protein
VELQDESGSLVASLFGEDVKKVLRMLCNKINVIQQ